MTLAITTLNATPEYIFANTWGYWNKTTNRLSGMLGDIFYGRAQVGGTPSFITKERIDQFDFLTKTSSAKVAFIIRSPPLSNVVNIYYLPFNSTVWKVSGLMVAISCLTIYLSVNRHLGPEKKLVTTTTTTIRISDVVLLAIGAICQMEFAIPTNRLSTRLSTVK